MTFQFAFEIDPATIRVQDAQTGYHLEVRNQAAYRPRTGLLLALGEAADTMRAQQGERGNGPAGEFRSVTLFGAEGAELSYELQALEHFTRLLHRQAQRAQPMAYIALKLVDRFDYAMVIQGYETFADARRQALEQGMQARLRLRRLVVNGQAVHIPLWRRTLEFWLRQLLTVLLPLATMVAGYLTMPPLFRTNPLSFLAYLLLITFFVYYAGRIGWMLLVRGLVPGDYGLFMLRGRRARLSWADRLLVRVIWRGYGHSADLDDLPQSW